MLLQSFSGEHECGDREKGGFKIVCLVGQGVGHRYGLELRRAFIWTLVQEGKDVHECFWTGGGKWEYPILSITWSKDRIGQDRIG